MQKETTTAETPPQKRVWPDRLTYREADEYLGAKSKTGAFTRALVKARIIRCVQLGYRTIQIPRSELDRFIRSRETAAVVR